MKLDFNEFNKDFLIKKELESYIQERNNNKLFEVIQNEVEAGLSPISKKDLALVFITLFNNTLANGYIHYSTSVLKKNPNFKTILDFRVWRLDILDRIVFSGQFENLGTSAIFNMETVKQVCKDYYYLNDFL